MKKKFYIAILILFIAGSGYMIYSVSPRKFQVKDVSSPESFKLYQSGKPESVELAVMVR